MASKATAAPAIVAAPRSKAVEKREVSANNYIAVLIVVTVLVVLISAYFAKGLIASDIRNGKVIGYQSTANNQLEAKLKAAPVLIENYRQLGAKRDTLAHALPTDPDFPELVIIAQNMAANAGVALASVSPVDAIATTGAPSTTGAAVPYQFNVEVGGTYPQIVQFFRNVELSVRPIRVVSSDFSGSDGALRASVTLGTYYKAKASLADKTETVQ